MNAKKYLIPLLLLAPLIILLAVVLFVRKNKLTEFKPNTTEVSALEKWRSYEYQPVVLDEALKGQLNGLQIISSNFSLTLDQQQALSNCAYRFVAAYSTNDFESYLDFALPLTNGVFDTEIINFRLSRLKYVHFKDSDKLSVTDARLIISYWWDFWAGNHDRSSLGEDQDSLQANVIKEISMNPSGWFLVQSKNLSPNEFRDFINKRENAGILVRHHFFHFSPTPNEVLAQDGKLQYAILMIYFNSKANPPMPAYVMYYWAPSPGKWLPLSVGIPFGAKHHHDFLF